MSEQQSRSPDTAQGGERKRRRKVLSCHDCRRRKLLCDRGLPACGRCTKAGLAVSCLYIENAAGLPGRDERASMNETPHNSRLAEDFRPSVPNMQLGGSIDNFTARLDAQERRIQRLEASLQQANHIHRWTSQQQVEMMHRTAQRLPDTPETTLGKTYGLAFKDRETVVLRGKAFKTQFHGTTHPDAAISIMPELHIFTNEAFKQFPALSRIRCDLKALDERTPQTGSVPTNSYHLSSLLPERAQSNQLVQLYLDSWEYTYHILHWPSYSKEYEEMWSDPTKARPSFVALTLLLMAATRCLTSEEPWLYTANSSSARETAVNWINVVDDWLLRQSQKHVTCTDFQIRILLLLAKQVNARKFKRIWTDAGALVRFGMSAGLHRNPDMLRKKTSALDKEMRRRLWGVMVELDLQASIDRGMMATAWDVQANCPAPKNLHDDDFDSEGEELTVTRPLSELTRSSFLQLSHSTVILRHKLNSVLNDPRSALTFDEVKKYTEEIENHLSQLPVWTEDNARIPHALLDLQLRQYLLMIHTQHIRFSDSAFAREYSKVIFMDAAQSIVDTHGNLAKQKNYALEVLRNDVLRAGLSACWLAITVDPDANGLLNCTIKQTAHTLTKEAIEMLNDKVIRFGREQRQLWCAAAAYGLLKSKADPERRQAYMQEAVDTVTRPYYRIMACQEDPPTPTPQSSTATVQVQDSVPDFMSAADQQRDVIGFAAGVFSFDSEDISAWTFDNWAFDPGDLQQPFPSGL